MSEWIKNTGVQPINGEYEIDVKVTSGNTIYNTRSTGWRWVICVGCQNVTHWRLSKSLEDAYDEPTHPSPTTHYWIPMKSEKHGKLSDIDILAAFNKLTGAELSADNYVTLLTLQELFDNRN